MTRQTPPLGLVALWFLLAACGSAAPHIAAISPNQGTDKGGASVELTGTGFKAGVQVFFGARPATQVQQDSATHLWALTPAGTGVVDVSIRNPDGQSAKKTTGYTYVSHTATRPGCRSFSQRRPAGCTASSTPFQVDITTLGLSSATTVQLAGEFTNWQDSPITMQQTGSTLWSVSVPGLRPGSREYKFVVDGNWYADPKAPAEPIYGNSVKTVVDPCLPGVSITAPLMGSNLTSAPVHVTAATAPGRGMDGTPRTIAASDTVLCVDDVEYPASLDAAGRLSADLPLPEGRHRLTVQVKDSGGFVSLSAWTYFNLQLQHHPPIANPGPTLFVRTGTQVILDGANSWDPDGNPLTAYKWSTSSASVSFDASLLADGYVTPPEGYQSNYGSNDPNAMPATTPARKLYTPTSAGISTVQLSVADANGTSSNADNQMQVIAVPSTGPSPQIVLNLSAPSFGPVVLDASGSQASPQATYRWLGDAKNPSQLVLDQYLSNGNKTLSLPRSLLTEGVWRFYVWIEDTGGASWPGGAQVLVRDGVLRVDDYMLGPRWAYQGPMDELFVRRFNDSDGDGIGDLNGVTQKLDYLKGLGIETLWLMPIFTSDDHDHGYHPIDYYEIEPDYGTKDDLLNLLKEAHKRGMHVILDLVINHTSRRHPFFLDALNDFMSPSDSGPAGWFFNSYIWFTNNSTSLLDKYGWGRQMGGTRLTLSGGWADIPDLNYGDPETRRYLFDMAKYWADPNGDGDFSDGVDGYRLDHVTGPDHSVWASFRSELKAFNPDLLLVGEVFTDFDAGGSGYGIKDYYHGELDSAFTFPVYFAFQDLFAGHADASELQSVVDELSTNRFPVGALHFSFLENHDVPNPPDFAQYGPDKLKTGLIIEAALPPVPHAIWGQELGLSEWRGWVPWSKEGPGNDLENTFRAVMTARRDQSALREGSFAWAPTSAAGSAIGIVRQAAGSPTIIVVANTSGNPLTTLTVDLSNAGSGSKLMTVAGNATATIDAQRQLHLSLPSWTGVMYALTE